MQLQPYFKSVLDQDTAQIVICDLHHTILYRNPAAAAAYRSYGELLGKSLLACHNARSVEKIEQVLAWFALSPENNQVHTFFSEQENKDIYMVALRGEDGSLIGYYEKHEARTRDPAGLYKMD